MNIRLLGTVSQIMLMAIVVSIVLLVVGIGVLVLIHACVVGRAFQREPGTVVTERCSDGMNGLSTNDLEKLPSYSYSLGDEGGSAIDCAICLETFQMGDRCRLLPACKHSFHAHCVDSWLLKSPLCPICRAAAGAIVLEQQWSSHGERIGLGVEERPSVVLGLRLSAAPSTFQASTLSIND